jgi:pyridoxamine 5'-phosphate oxidase
MERGMKMNFSDCVAFANENPIAWLATADADQPRVRALGMWFADESGFYFQIGAAKDVYAQLLKNPTVEFAFYHPGDNAGTVLRISGKIEFLSDPALKQRVLEDRPFLKQFGLTVDHPGLIIFRIAQGEAHFWNMASNMKPKEIITFG